MLRARSHKDRDGNTGYVCACGRKHLYHVYAVAQMAQQNTVHHACTCKRVNVCYDFMTMIGNIPNNQEKTQ